MFERSVLEVSIGLAGKLLAPTEFLTFKESGPGRDDQSRKGWSSDGMFERSVLEVSIGRPHDSCALKSNSFVGTQAAASRNGPRAWGPTVFSDPYLVSNIFETLILRNPFPRPKRRVLIAVSEDCLLPWMDFKKK